MARTITWDELRDLAAFEAAKGCAISLYLDLDPSVSPTAGDASTRLNSLLDEGAKADGANKRVLTHDQKLGLRADFERIRSFFSTEFSRDGAHGLAVFTATMDNIWRPLALTESVPDEIHVGRLEELADLHEDQPRRHDQGGWSQSWFQRHVDKLAEEHLREVAEELDRLVRRLRGPQVVVVAPEEARAEFSNLLSQEARNAIIGWAHAKAHAQAPELLTAARPVLESWRAEREKSVLARWREESGRNGRASAGWADTLTAASDGRVETLLFQDGVDREAFQCPACGRVAAEAGKCPLDGTSLEPHEGGLDLAVHQTLAHGGMVWAVRGRQDLQPVEGIGALLRY